MMDGNKTDQTALLRAEKETTRRVADLNKLRPLIEQHAEVKLDIKSALDLQSERSRKLEVEILKR